MKIDKNIVSAIIIALGIAALGLCIKAGVDNFSSKDRVITVRGLAEKEVPANKVTWPIVCKFVSNDISSIYNDIQASNDKILRYLKNNGVNEDEISINAPEILDLQADRYVSSYIKYRYNVTQVIVVVSNNVDKIRGLITNQSELLKQGVTVTSGDYQNQVVYEFTDLNSIKPEMISNATKAAREAGDQFALDSQSKLGKIKTAVQGQFSIEDRDSNTPHIKKVRVVSYITFYLED